MSDTSTTRGTLATPAAIQGRAANIALWALQGPLAFVFAGGGVLKPSGDPAMVDLFASVGAGQWFRYAVGAAETAGAVGLLIPRLSGVAALGLAWLMLGAAATNLFVLGAGPWLPLALLLLSALVAHSRRPRSETLGGRRRR